MRRIISISRRSDIAAFYSKWFLRRIEAGFCEWLHPFGGRLLQASLRPEDCLALVFWTRNPAPLLPALAGLDRAGYCSFFHFTLTGYPRELETHNPPVETSVRRFHELAERVGPERIIWRYDPVVISSLTPVEYHLERFGKLARELSGATRKVYFSFVSIYGKTRGNFEQVTREHGVVFSDPDTAARRELALRLADMASAHEMTLYSCCEDALVGDGIEKGRCVDIELLRSLRPDATEDVPRRPSRKECGCSASVDIGAYDTCLFGCRYCYATRSRDAALARHRAHDPEDTMLWRPATSQPHA